MKTRYAVVTVLVVLAMIVPATAVLASSSDATGSGLSSSYYHDQLTADQQSVYDQLAAITSDSLKDTPSAYGYDVAANSVSDVIRAWEALRMDKPLSVVTWVTGTDLTSDSVTVVTAGSAYYIVADSKIVTGSDLASAKTALADKVSAVNSLIDKVTVSGDLERDKVKSINSTLTDNTVYRLDKEGKYDFSNCIYGATVENDKLHYLSSLGFAALYKAVADKAGLECIQVYGTYDADKPTLYAWNEVGIDGYVYGVDSATNCDSSDHSKWLAAGRYTASGSDSFAKVHMAFVFPAAAKVSYDFASALMCNNGYSWPTDTSIIATLTAYAPWILVGIICIVLAVVLVQLARKEGA